MRVDEIAKKLCEHTYLKQCDPSEKARTNATFSLEEYWERNKKYFIDRANIYLEVKECLEVK